MSKKKIVLPLIIILILLFVIIGIASRRGPKYLVVEAERVEAGDLSKEVSANGIIESSRKTAIVAQIAGTVERIFKEEGEAVAKDAAIVLLDQANFMTQQKNALSNLESTRRRIQEELLNLRAAFTEAKVKYDQVKRNFDSVNELYSLKLKSDEELSLAKESLEVADDVLQRARQALNFREGRPLDYRGNQRNSDDKTIVENSLEVRQALDSLATVERDLRECRIESRIPGVLSDLHVEEGGVVAPGTLIAVVQNMSSLEAVVDIDEVDIGYVSLHQKASIESDTFIGKTLAGEVVWIAPVVKQVGDSRVCKVKITVQDPQGMAKIGSSCTIFITVQKREGVPTIPFDLYFQEDGKNYVYALEPVDKARKLYKVHKTEVGIGILGIEKVEITKPLAVGDLIIKERLKSLEDGQTVKIKSLPPAAEALPPAAAGNADD